MPLKKLMVLTDFTAASNTAAAHCFQLATLSNSEVVSLHVISHDEDLEWAEKKATEQIKRVVNYDARISFKPLTSSQNLFLGLNKWLVDQGVGLTFMATHGKKDLQFITGSSALKLILNAEAPMVVVQHNTQLRPYKHILLPIFNHQAEMLFPVETLQIIVRIFGSKLTLLTPATESANDHEEMQKTIQWLSEMLKTDASEIEVVNSHLSGKKFSNEVISLAKEMDADLVAVIIGARHHREESDKGKKFFQSLITNEHGVPVLCL